MEYSHLQVPSTLALGTVPTYFGVGALYPGAPGVPTVPGVSGVPVVPGVPTVPGVPVAPGVPPGAAPSVISGLPLPNGEFFPAFYFYRC